MKFGIEKKLLANLFKDYALVNIDSLIKTAMMRLIIKEAKPHL